MLLVVPYIFAGSYPQCVHDLSSGHKMFIKNLYIYEICERPLTECYIGGRRGGHELYYVTFKIFSLLCHLGYCLYLKNFKCSYLNFILMLLRRA